MQSILPEGTKTRLASELAAATGITEEQAMAVLKVMHVDKLDENMAAHHKVMSDPLAVNALNLSRDAATSSLAVSRPESVTLGNLRMGIKPTGVGGILV
jgi:hypothetical protein